MPENLRMVTSKINQNNKGACENKIDWKQTINDIIYLKYWISHVEKTKTANKQKYSIELKLLLERLNIEVNNQDNI
jgi:hypothetical protein